MDIQVRLKDVGWTKLYVQTDAKDNTMFLLVDNNLDVSKPYLTLKMKDDSLAIKHQRGEVEDDNEKKNRNCPNYQSIMRVTLHISLPPCLNLVSCFRTFRQRNLNGITTTFALYCNIINCLQTIYK